MKNIIKLCTIALSALLLTAQVKAQTFGQDLVIYYNFDETTGNILTDTAPDGVATNASVVSDAASLNDNSFAGDTMADLTTDSVNVNFGSAMWSPLDGPFVSIDDTPDNVLDINSPTTYTVFGNLASNQDWSINFWVNAVDGARHFALTSIDSTLSTTDQAGFAIFQFGNGTGRLMTTGASGTGTQASFGWNEVNTFVMLTITFDRDAGNNSTGLLSLYKNGALANSVSAGAALTGTVGNIAMLLGSQSEFTNQRQFIFDEFAVWHRLLGATQIGDLHTEYTVNGNMLSDIFNIVPVELSNFSIE